MQDTSRDGNYARVDTPSNPPITRRVIVREAADILGTTTGAVRKRQLAEAKERERQANERDRRNRRLLTALERLPPHSSTIYRRPLREPGEGY